ncbi:MAG: hypothetical protein WAK33_07070 [Silvibacterium sp.]
MRSTPTKSTAWTFSPSQARKLLVALSGVVEGGGAGFTGVGGGGVFGFPAAWACAEVEAPSANENAAAEKSAVRHRWPSIREKNNQPLVFAFKTFLGACSNLNACH